MRTVASRIPQQLRKHHQLTLRQSQHQQKQSVRMLLEAQRHKHHMRNPQGQEALIETGNQTPVSLQPRKRRLMLLHHVLPVIASVARALQSLGGVQDKTSPWENGALIRWHMEIKS